MLLLLRVTVGVTLITQGAAYLPELSKISDWTVCLLALGGGLGLLLGILTRVFGAIAVAGYIGLTFQWLPAPSYNFFHENPLSYDVILMAVVCMLLGPGAFSLDGHFFGRRKIVIPQSSAQASEHISHPGLPPERPRKQ
ncbi:MAG: hypothetical protein JST79_05390 [Acidobacteria bacterium]|nr:hypothetical protein [Acidobacteriota bacterium]